MVKNEFFVHKSHPLHGKRVLSALQVTQQLLQQPRDGAAAAEWSHAATAALFGPLLELLLKSNDTFTKVAVDILIQLLNELHDMSNR